VPNKSPQSWCLSAWDAICTVLTLSQIYAETAAIGEYSFHEHIVDFNVPNKCENFTN